MINSFKNFLNESPIIVNSLLSEGAIVGNVNDPKGLRHLKNYINPFLSKTHLAQSEKNLEGHVKPGEYGKENGAQYNSKATHTHTLDKTHNGYPAGTKVRINGPVTKDDKGRLYVSTAKHGPIPVSKLAKPEALAKPAATKGFSLEQKVANNIGGTAQGASKGTDIQLSLKHEDGNKQHNVNAKIIETKEKPDVRIESKLDRGKVGEATIKFSTEKGWHVSERSPNRALGESHLKHATYDDPEHPDHGMPVLDFLNKHHSNGKVGQYRYFKAAPGTSEAYFKQTGANYAHIHDVDKDYGTTFTTGDGHELKGKTNLGHLSRAQLEQMNHRIEIHPTTTGTTTMVHRPKRSFMKHLAASATENPSEHGDLSNPEHAKEFLNKAKSALGIKS